MNAKLVIICYVLVAAAAMPRYALLPVEALQPRMRVLRQVSLPAAVPAASDRFVRQSKPGYGGHTQVDYGAYTGAGGAFGWYSDYPVGGRY